MVGVSRLILGFFCLVSSVGISADVTWKVLTDLDVFEPFDAHVFHDNLLWVGRSRKNLGADYRLEIFDNAGNQSTSKELQHSPRFLYPYGAHGVISVGVSYKDNMTYYTIIEKQGSALNILSKMIPLGAYGNEWAGKPGTHIFLDPGGYDDGSPIGVTLKTLFTLTGGGFRYFEPRIPGPHHPRYIGNKLYLIEHPSVMSGGRYLDLVNLKQSKPEHLVTGQDFTNLIALDNEKVLAVADRGANEIVIFDIATKSVLRKIAVDAGSPQSIAVFGKCIVAGAAIARKLAFYDWQTGAAMGEWDVSGVGDKLFEINSVVADSASGRVYVRSNNPASVTEPLKSPDRNSVVMVEETSHTMRDKCR